MFVLKIIVDFTSMTLYCVYFAIIMDCIFCKIISGEIPSKRLSESTYSIAILDAFPLAAGHTLVMPKRHCQKIQDMTSDENADLFAMVQKMTSRIDFTMTGSSLIAIHNGKDAGQEVPHLHVHIVPRTSTDSAGAIHALFSNPATKMSDSDATVLCSKLCDKL